MEPEKFNCWCCLDSPPFFVSCLPSFLYKRLAHLVFIFKRFIQVCLTQKSVLHISTWNSLQQQRCSWLFSSPASCAMPATDFQSLLPVHLHLWLPSICLFSHGPKRHLQDKTSPGDSSADAASRAAETSQEDLFKKSQITFRYQQLSKRVSWPPNRNLDKKPKVSSPLCCPLPWWEVRASRTGVRICQDYLEGRPLLQGEFGVFAARAWCLTVLQNPPRKMCPNDTKVFISQNHGEIYGQFSIAFSSAEVGGRQSHQSGEEPWSFKTSVVWLISIGELDGLLLGSSSSSHCHRNRNLWHLWHLFHFYNETTGEKLWKGMICPLNLIIPRDPPQFSMSYR